MSTVPTTRIRAATAAALSLWLALTLTPVAGGTEPALRLGYVRGRLVHLRSDVPQESLRHDNVLRHLTPGEVFVTDDVRTGISHTGKGTGAWFHVRRLNDPTESGWISGEYLVLIAGEYLPVPQEESLRSGAPATMTTVQNHEHNFHVDARTHTVVQPPSGWRWVEELRVKFAPIASFVSDLTSIIASFVKLLLFFVLLLISGHTLRTFALALVGVPATATAGAAAAVGYGHQPPTRVRTPKRLYFNNCSVRNPSAKES